MRTSEADAHATKMKSLKAELATLNLELTAEKEAFANETDANDEYVMQALRRVEFVGRTVSGRADGQIYDATEN